MKSNICLSNVFTRLQARQYRAAQYSKSSSKNPEGVFNYSPCSRKSKIKNQQ